MQLLTKVCVVCGIYVALQVCVCVCVCTVQCWCTMIGLGACYVLVHVL